MVFFCFFTSIVFFALCLTEHAWLEHYDVWCQMFFQEIGVLCSTTYLQNCGHSGKQVLKKVISYLTEIFSTNLILYARWEFLKSIFLWEGQNIRKNLPFFLTYFFSNIVAFSENINFNTNENVTKQNNSITFIYVYLSIAWRPGNLNSLEWNKDHPKLFISIFLGVFSRLQLKYHIIEITERSSRCLCFYTHSQKPEG